MFFLAAILQLASPHDPILDQPSRPLTHQEIVAPATQQFFDDMILLAEELQDLSGLAAPQVGYPLRVILVDHSLNRVPDLHLYINPQILSSSQDLEEYSEGCFSVGDLVGLVPRSRSITLTALDRSGQPLLESHTGFIARIFQHEIDHLDGIRFPQRMSTESVLYLVRPDEYPAYHALQNKADWPISFPQRDWLKQIN